MDNQLPTEFDLVIVGTGIIESILSAAASRIGKTVLHVDSNDYYGGQWASFNLKALHNFTPTYNQEEPTCADYLPLGNNVFNIKDFQCKWHIPEKVETNNDISNIDQNVRDLNISEEAVDECPTQKKEETLETGEEKTSEKVALEKDNREIEYTQERLIKESRKFNIDLVPKIHFARGDFVELLISSNIARYVEYRSVSRILTWLNGQLEVVPCSRSDVFANNKVSVIEKRLLMKLLTSLDESVESIKDDDRTTFLQFLKEKKLSTNLIHYVLYAMSRSTEFTLLKDGIEGTKRFLNSLGRFGKTPFLFSMYGSGETTQAFCRLSAVFGGVFALNQTSLTGLKLNENKATFLVNGDQEIKADHFVLSAEKSPSQYIESVKVQQYLSRAIFITDRSIMPSDQEHLTLLLYPPENGRNLTTIIEMGHLTGTCPKGLVLVHLTSKQVTNPQDDFQHITKNLFTIEREAENKEEAKPKILWSCFFSLPLTDDLDLNTNLPENVFLCSGPDSDLDYDLSIKRAKDIFSKMYPDLEFLPRAPDPEEIIIGCENSQEDSEAFSANNDCTEGEKN